MKKALLTALTGAVAAALVILPGQSGEVHAAGPGGNPKSGYVAVNGLDMYYEVHGKDRGQPPLVLLHGALSATGTSFGAVLPQLAKDRQVISVEQQAHGHTADIDRPLRTAQMADDTVKLLRAIGVERADFFGYSMGAGIALDIGIEYPDIVRKLVLTSGSYDNSGVHPGALDGISQLEPEHLYGSPFHEEYLEIAPRPEDFDQLVERVKDISKNYPDRPRSAVESMEAPALVVIGDSDLVRPEHAVDTFRALGGGVFGDVEGMPNSQLAVLPGSSHISVMHQADLLVRIIPAFLDAPIDQ